MQLCNLCGEAGATYPSATGPGVFLCFDAVACLERFGKLLEAEGFEYEEEDFESD